MSAIIPIELSPYQPDWPIQFDLEKQRLMQTIGQYVHSVEHVGSTAVPGLSAKPVIDIMVGVHHLSDAPAFIPPLAALGYIYIADLESVIPERRYLQKVVDGRHTHHLHMVDPRSSFYKDHLLFRDYLRAHPAEAKRYQALKVQLARRFRYERDTYTDSKSDLICEMLDKAKKELNRSLYG